MHDCAYFHSRANVVTESDYKKYHKNNVQRGAEDHRYIGNFTRPPSPVLTAFVSLSSEVMYFQRRRVLQPVVLLRCCTKTPVNCASSTEEWAEPTRLRRLDLLDRLLLDPTPPAVYWRCRLNFFSSSSYRTLLLGFGGPGDLDSRFGENSDWTGERSPGRGRPVKYTMGRSKTARHEEEMKKNVDPATRPENTGNLDTSPLNGFYREYTHPRPRLGKDKPDATMP